jgi:orotate phosphoribosyltransferase
MSYKREFIEFLMDANVLQFGKFITKSGRETPYFFNAGKIRTGKQICEMGKFYAAVYNEKIANKNSVLYGPAYKGISIAVSASVALANEGLDLPFFFNRKEVKDHGEGGIFVGYQPQQGEEIVIVEDVITAGTAIRESMDILSTVKDSKVTAAIVMVDRMERGQNEISAIQEIKETYGFPVYPIITVLDIIAYLEETGADPALIADMHAYLAKYGAKQN